MKKKAPKDVDLSPRINFFSYYKKDFCSAWVNFVGKHVIIALFHLFFIFFCLMIAYVDYTSSVLEKVAPLDKLERFDGSLLETSNTHGKNRKFYIVIKSEGEEHKLRFCSSSIVEHWDRLKKYQGQLITLWVRPQFNVFYWTKCVTQMKFGSHLMTKDYPSYYLRVLKSEQEYPQRLKWDLYRIIGALGFFGIIWFFYRTPELINQRRK